MKKLETVALFVRTGNSILRKLGSRYLIEEKTKKEIMEHLLSLPKYKRNRAMHAYKHVFVRALDKLFLNRKEGVAATKLTRKEIVFLAKNNYYIRNGILTIC